MLDAHLPPEDKIAIAPDLFGGLNTDDPRGELQKSIANASPASTPSQATELDRLGDTLDDVVTGAVRQAFRPDLHRHRRARAARGADPAARGAGDRRPRPALDRRRRGPPRSLAAAGYGVAYAASGQETVPIRDPCQDRQLPDTGGITGELQDISLAALDRAACSFGSSREELLLALFDDRLQHKFEEEHGVNPRSVLSLGPALLGL